MSATALLADELSAVVEAVSAGGALPFGDA